MPSGEMSHFSARAGSMSVLSSLYLTSPSYIAVVAMNPSWAVIVGGSSLSVSPPQRKVRVLAAVGAGPAAAGLAASAGLAAAAGAVVAAGAGAVVAAAAGLAASAGF